MSQPQKQEKKKIYMKVEGVDRPYEICIGFALTNSDGSQTLYMTGKAEIVREGVVVRNLDLR